MQLSARPHGARFEILPKCFSKLPMVLASAWRDEHLHLLAYGSGGLQNAAAEHQYSWYAALLFTY